MLKELIDWDIIAELNSNKENIDKIFLNSIVVTKYSTNKQIGIIYKIDDSKIVMSFLNYEDLSELNIINNSYEFSTLRDAMNYLREVRFDHAINYEIKDLAEPLLGELYKNKKVEIKDILGA